MRYASVIQYEARYHEYVTIFSRLPLQKLITMYKESNSMYKNSFAT